jgi:CHASE2 domain-containing sensor protein
MILTLLVGLFLMHESRLAPVDALEESFADFLAMNSRRTEQPAPVTLVGINEASLRLHPLPWTPLDFALFFQSANHFGPDILATNAVLAWDYSPLTPAQQAKYEQYGKILREQLLRSPKVLLGARLGFPEDPDRPLADEAVPVLRHVKGDASRVPDYTTIEAQAGENYRLSSALGFTNLPGASNWHRSVPLVLRYRGQLVPTFVLQAVILWEKLTLDEVRVEIGSKIALGDQVEIPIDAAGQMRVDFGVPRGRCGLDDLVLAAAQFEAKTEMHVPPETFAGKLLLLARVDQDSKDMRLAAGRKGSEGELLAAAIGTVQSRTFIQRAPAWVEWVVIGLTMIASLWLPRWRKGPVVFKCALALLFYVLTALWVFGQRLVWIPMLVPSGLALFLAAYRLAIPGTEGILEQPPRMPESKPVSEVKND